MIGSTLGHYRILERLGRGGMGEVYRAEDTRLKRQVALKVIPPDVVADEARLKRFRREAEALAALDHPGVVAVHSVEEVDGVQFLTMALVEGRTLAEEIEDGAATLERFFGLAIRIADALAASHERGVVHRDLKPANIMVDGDGRPRILDFGLAQLRRPDEAAGDSEAATQLTRDQAVLGTLPYMSPEQLRGDGVDERTDVFSLGIVLYELATGRYPFEGVSPAELASSILKDEPRPVHEVRTELPRQLGRILQGCLQKDPRHRCQSARDLCNQLRALRRELEAEAILGRDSGPEAARVEHRARNGNPAWTAVAAVVVLVAALAAPFLYQWAGAGSGDAGGETATIDSLVVLPFENLMNDPEQEYFVQGMSESLIADLSRVGALRVISRTSARHYRGADRTIPEIAEELDVDAVIEGSVLRDGNRVRITAQLIDARDDRQLWAASYDRDLEDVLGVLTEVARTVVREIEVQLSPELEERLANRQTVDPEVQEAVLRGRYLLNVWRAEDLSTALGYYQEALRLAPEHAPAWAGLATAHYFLVQLSGEPDVHRRAAREAASRALELDEGLSEAHAVVGWVKLTFDSDWEAAAAAFRRALELDRNDVWAQFGYSSYLTLMGRPEEGLEHARLGLRSDPLAPMAHVALTSRLLQARRYREAEVAAREALELFPGHPNLTDNLARSLWRSHRHDEAIAEWTKLDPDFGAALQAAYDRGGADGVREFNVETWVGLAEQYDGAAFGAGEALAALGRPDAALAWLERAHAADGLQALNLVTSPAFDSLRSDPRFLDLLERIGLPTEFPEYTGDAAVSEDPAGP